MDSFLNGIAAWGFILGVPIAFILAVLFLASRVRRLEKPILKTCMSLFGLWFMLALLGACASLYGDSLDAVEVINESSRTILVATENDRNVRLLPGDTALLDGVGGIDSIRVSSTDRSDEVTFEFEYGLYGDENTLRIIDPREEK
jgi:hypothetical protein